MGIFSRAKPAKKTGDYSGLIHDPPRSRLVLFIHGLGGDEKTTWGKFPKLIAHDPELAKHYDVASFGYPTGIGRGPSASEIADLLKSEIDREYSHYSDIAIIAHSLGGLIARRYIANLLEQGAPDGVELKVRRLITFATPHLGAILAVISDKIPLVGQQVKDLSIDSEFLLTLGSAWHRQLAEQKLKTRYVVALEDQLVTKTSSLGPQRSDGYATVRGGHMDCVKPDDAEHESFKEAKSFLMDDSAGHFARPGAIYTQPVMVFEFRKLAPASRFFYGAQATRFIGRDREMGELRQFLKAEGELFQWMLVTGKGGVGKSRLGLELCVDVSPEWYAGFLRGPDRFEKWDLWQPVAPTLLVVDYASQDNEKLRGIMTTLARRCAPAHPEPLQYPVRLLLLDRPRDDNWINTEIAKGSGADRTIIQATQYSDEMKLLAPPDVWTMMEDMFAQKKFSPGQSKLEILEILEKVDREKRPLYAMFLADALAEGRFKPEWDAEALVRDVIERERGQFWQPANITNEDEYWLALATMTGGITVEQAKSFENNILPVWRPMRHREQFRVMTGREARDNLSPLEPDIVGELFTLELLEQDPDRARGLIEYAWNNHPRGVYQFADRCGQDFIEHDALKLLHDVKPENAAGQFARAGFAALLIHAYGDAERFGEAVTLYDDLKALAGDPDATPEIRDLHAQGAFILILAYCEAERLDEAKRFYEDLKSLAESPDATPDIRLRQARGAFILLLDYCEAGRLDEAEALYDDLKALAGDPDATPEIRDLHAQGAFILILAYCEAERLDEARTLYDNLKTLAEAPDATPEIRLLQAKGASGLSWAYMMAGDLTEAWKYFDKFNDLANELDDKELLAARPILQEELDKLEQAAEPGAVKQAEVQEPEPVEPHTLPQAVPQTVPKAVPMARHQPSTAIRLLQGAVLLILSTVLLTLVFTAVVIASEPHLRGLIDQLGGASWQHHLVDLVLAGLKALP